VLFVLDIKHFYWAGSFFAFWYCCMSLRTVKRLVVI
jgi:hypothetical protein